MRVLAALVLAPLAIALAYAGGWLWALLVTLVSIGLFAEWLMVVGAGSAALTGRRDDRHRHRWALCVAFGALKTAVITGCRRRRDRDADRAGQVRLGRDRLRLCIGGAAGLDPGAAGSRERLRRADVRAARGVGDRYRRLFRRPQHWRTEAVAARQPQEDLGRRARRLCGEPCGCGRLCRLRARKGGSTAARRAPSCRWCRRPAICSNPR